VIIGGGVTGVEMAGAVAELSWRPASANPALMEAIVVRVSDRHRQLPSYLHSATIFSRLLTRCRGAPRHGPPVKTIKYLNLENVTLFIAFH
jgi:hypothetical protein